MSQFIAIFVGFVFFALVFLVARELMAWYWKINEGLQLLRTISGQLEEAAKLQRQLVNIQRAQLDAASRQEPDAAANG